MTAPPSSASTSESTLGRTSSGNTSLWSDVPRRLTTICIGFPLVWTMLKTPSTAYLFFMGAHALSAWEFTLLEPKLATESIRPPTGATTTQKQQSSSPSSTSLSSSTTPIARGIFCVTSLLLASIPTLPSSSPSSSTFLLALILTAGTFALIQKRHWMVGLLLVTVPFRTWMVQCQDFASTISLLLVVWNADTGALLGGRVASFLWPQPHRRLPVPEWIRTVSPQKSMEGFLGGIVGGTWTAVTWIPPLISWANIDTSPAFVRLWGLDGPGADDDHHHHHRSLGMGRRRLVIGLGLSLLAIAGDLVESSIKRQSSSKDSGRALPGHGGILDRFDSSLLAVLLYQALIEWADASPEPKST